MPQSDKETQLKEIKELMERSIQTRKHLEKIWEKIESLESVIQTRQQIQRDVRLSRFIETDD